MEEKDLKQPSAEETTEAAPPKKKTASTAKKTGTAAKTAKPKTAAKTASNSKSTATKPKSTTKKTIAKAAKPETNVEYIVQSETAKATESEIQNSTEEIGAEKVSEETAVSQVRAEQEKIEIEVPAVSDEVEVARFSVTAAEEAEAKPAEKSADEIAKEISDEISAEEKAKIDAAQQKADKQYHDILGDRRIKKPSKFVARIIAAVIIILIVVVVITKIPMFFNCMVPNGDVVKKLNTLMGVSDYEQANTDEEVWRTWYYWDENELAYKPTRLPNSQVPDKEPYAYADRNLTKNYAEMHMLVGKKQAGYELSDIKYVTVILYEFDSVDKAREYGQRKAEQYTDFGGQHDFQDMLIYKLGMAHAETPDFIYDAWYNGGNYIEVYASDKDLAERVRQTLNYNA